MKRGLINMEEAKAISGVVLRHLVNNNKHTEFIDSCFCGDKYLDISFGNTYIY